MLFHAREVIAACASGSVAAEFIDVTARTAWSPLPPARDRCLGGGATSDRPKY